MSKLSNPKWVHDRDLYSFGLPKNCNLKTLYSMIESALERDRVQSARKLTFSIYCDELLISGERLETKKETIKRLFTISNNGATCTECAKGHYREINMWEELACNNCHIRVPNWRIPTEKEKKKGK
jgi:hypothetical protein